MRIFDYLKKELSYKVANYISRDPQPKGSLEAEEPVLKYVHTRSTILSSLLFLKSHKFAEMSIILFEKLQNH